MKKKTIKATLRLKKVAVSHFNIKGGRLGTHYDFCDPNHTDDIKCIIRTAQK